MTRCPHPHRRRGTMVPILGVMSVALFSMVALAIDLGVLTIVRTECQSTADMAALVGCRILSNKTSASNNGAAEAMTAAKEVCLDNKVMGSALTHSQISNIRVGVYDYNTTTGRFDAPTQWGTAYQPVAPTPTNPNPSGPSPGAAPTNKAWTAIEVTTAVQQPTFFARLFGVTTMSSGAKALAVHRPRDVAFVLDYSGSMGFGSVPSWPYTTNGDVTVPGLNSPDPRYPKFGHYGRYVHYNNARTTTGGQSSTNATDRPHPFEMRALHTSEGYAFAPANTTTDAVGGPPMTEGDYSDDGNSVTPSGFCEAVGNPSNINSSTVWRQAFSWNPPRTARANTVTLTPATYNYAGYNAFGRIATPAPPNFDTQSDTPYAYVGDKWPRKDGGRGAPSSGPWASAPSGNTFTEQWAYTLKEFLGARTFPANTYTTSGNLYNTSTVNNTNPSQMLTNSSSPSGNNVDGTAGLDGRRIILLGTGKNFTIPGQSTHSSQASVTGYGTVTTTGTWEVRDGGDTNFNYRDWFWDRFGYDLDVEDYRANNGAPPSGNIKEIKLLPVADRFKGYSMGPGYWGKTFFIWPPDPRWGNVDTGSTSTMAPESISSSNPLKDTNGNWIADWRCRFFRRGNSTPSTPVYFNPQTDDVNGILFATNRSSGAFSISQGHTLDAPTNSIGSGNTASNQPGYYEINYRAILAWIKSGPQVFPGNLRSGRYVYYKSIPDDCLISGDANSDLNLDKRFWREYIHFVLGVGATDTTNYPIATPINTYRVLASTEANFGLNYHIGTPATFDPNGTNTPGVNPKPYMAYTDNINRPRAHFWFGPLTMIHFLEYAGSAIRPWYSGTVREAQCWQLKAAMSSVLDDMRVNHPNDFCGLSFFANRSEFRGPRAPMSQDWFTLKNALYFRDDVIAILKAFPDDPVEYRPYTSTFGNNAINEIPNSQGGTDPNNGLAVAYNLLSSSTSLTKYTTVTSPSGNSTSAAPVYGERGRRGAAKIVVFETDGVPNATATWRYTGYSAAAPQNTYFTTGSGTTPSTSGISSINSAANAALAITRVIVANTTANPPGFSTPNTKARVYAIGFGDIFEGWPAYDSMSGDGQTAHTFLLDMQKQGFTSGTGDTRMPERNIISGPFETPNPSMPVSAENPLGRIEKLRDCLERIMQSGVQVTLIQ